MRGAIVDQDYLRSEQADEDRVCESPEEILALASQDAGGGLEVADAQLGEVVGGLTGGDYATLDRFIRSCKYNGWTLQDAIEMTRRTYNRPAFQEITEQYIAYITEKW